MHMVTPLGVGGDEITLSFCVFSWLAVSCYFVSGFHAALSRGFVDGAFGKMFALLCISFSRIRSQILCFTAFKYLDLVIIVFGAHTFLSVPVSCYPEDRGIGVCPGSCLLGMRWGQGPPERGFWQTLALSDVLVCIRSFGQTYVSYSGPGVRQTAFSIHLIFRSRPGGANPSMLVIDPVGETLCFPSPCPPVIPRVFSRKRHSS